MQNTHVASPRVCSFWVAFCFFVFVRCFCLFCVCGEALKVSRKLCHRQKQCIGDSTVAAVLPGLGPIGFVESGLKSRKTRTLGDGGFVVCVCVCFF